MELEIISGPLSVCQVDDLDQVDLESGFYFIAKTDRELSLVCETAAVPRLTRAREDGWQGFRIKGQLDFSLVGVLSRLSGLLAEKGIGLFAVSTFDTDYILVKQEDFPRARAALAGAGYTFV